MAGFFFIAHLSKRNKNIIINVRCGIQIRKAGKKNVNSNNVMIKKLKNAINAKGEKLLYSSSEFYSEDAQRPITVYYIKQAVYNPKTGRNQNIELFHSGSQIQIVLFLRDYWYKLNNIPLPTGNKKWNKIRKKIEEGNK